MIPRADPGQTPQYPWRLFSLVGVHRQPRKQCAPDEIVVTPDSEHWAVMAMSLKTRATLEPERIVRHIAE
jgi:hypothetical protein